jgi:hypothetical protein
VGAWRRKTSQEEVLDAPNLARILHFRDTLESFSKRPQKEDSQIQSPVVL